MSFGRNEMNRGTILAHTGYCLIPLLLAPWLASASSKPADSAILKPETFAVYAEEFSKLSPQTETNAIPDDRAWPWMQENIPLFDCPDDEVRRIYYFRWWSFRKHIVRTPDGFVITEFLKPVSHAGPHNTISCATGFHIMEGRWIRDRRYLDGYIRFWFRGNGGKPQPHLHNYSGWLADAVWGRAMATGDFKAARLLLNDLVADYRSWENERCLPSGLYWQFDVRDGMEESISGSRTLRHIRPTINSYMYANARAIAKIAAKAGQKRLSDEFDRKADRLQNLVQTSLWDESEAFFKVRLETGGLSSAREAIGFIPWMFGLPEAGKGFEAAWFQLRDEEGFSAPFGITTAERRHPEFRSRGVGTCEWDGAVWPFATSQTLSAAARALREYEQTSLTTEDYFEAFIKYVRSQEMDGEPFIGEYLDETTGDWVLGKNDRSRYYNHSLFADLVITGIAGLCPSADSTIKVHPLVPAKTWDWFCLDNVPYHGRTLAILWDRTGTRYNRGAGLLVFVDGKEIARSATLSPLTTKLEVTGK